MSKINSGHSETPELSVVIPAFNEAAGLGGFLKQLFTELNTCCTRYEVWVIDDGSRDSTWSCIQAETHKHPYLRAARFTRNFGKEAAILAGLRQAKGQAVLIMDSDGQHPPSLLPELLKPWRAGTAQIVAAKKANRDADNMMARLKAHLFNRLMHNLTGLNLDGASDFQLLDRQVVDTLLAFPEKVRFFRGMAAWTGISTVTIPFHVAPRIAGDSQWSTPQLTQLAITAITSFSAKPLGLIFRMGLLGMVCAFLLLLQALYSRFTGVAISGWTSITVVILIFGSANLLGIGVLGAYLSQIFDEIKARPEFLIREVIVNPAESKSNSPSSID
jgi:glycosyltransferase involved in cell wall biosynthesis